MMRKYGALFGLVLGIGVVFGSYLLEGGSSEALFLIAPILIVFGGTFAAIIIGFGLDEFLKIFKLMKVAYFPAKFDTRKLITIYYDLSVKTRKKGLLSIEEDMYKLDYIFPKKLIRFLIDGATVETIESIALLEMKIMKERHYSNASIFSKMGGYAPTMGILGTVMALILTLANVGSDPNILIRNIATAFIATLWGVLSANLLWLPISDKLKKCHLNEKQMMEVALEGTLGMMSGEIPLVVKTRLVSLLPQQEQKEMLEL
ncbi:MAG: MotA/TolQ/ExbB proton channel family protein [Melioribacteraceae bacterium]|nr:MotA/TolQ/ExbB proton channel family protein [Melioribacteraceae bacterium]